MASAADLPTAFAKAERAAGRPLPRAGNGVPLRARSSDKAGPRAGRRARWPSSASGCVATPGTGATLSAAGLDVGACPRCRTLARATHRRRADPRRPLRPRRQHAAGLRGTARRLADPGGRLSRADPVHHDARRGAAGGRGDRARPGRDRRCSLQERLEQEAIAALGEVRVRRRLHSVVGVEPIGPYTLLRVERGGLRTTGEPGQFFMLEAPGRVLPRPMSLCLATRRASSRS